MMGCLSSSAKQVTELAYSARRRSSTWVAGDINVGVLTAEDWAHVFAVSNLIRNQGIEIDIMSLTFEKLFSKYPKTKLVLADAGILTMVDDAKFDARLRAHMREVAGAINRILELKSSDPESLEPFLRDLRLLHRRIKGFQFSYFESFVHCFDHAFTNLVGPAVSNQQKEAYRKFTVFIYKAMIKDELGGSTNKGMDHGSARRSSASV